MLNKKHFNSKWFILTKSETQLQTVSEIRVPGTTPATDTAIVLPAAGLKRTYNNNNHLCTVNGSKLTLINRYNFSQVLH